MLLFVASTLLAQRVDIRGRVDLGSGKTQFNVTPPLHTFPVHTWISFDTNNVGDPANTNTVIDTMRGWQLTSLTNVNGTSNMSITNGRANLNAFTLDGVTYLPRASNAFRYDHNAFPAQYIQGRFAFDVPEQTVGFMLFTSINGNGGGTYDLLQQQTLTDWCSCYIKDSTPPTIQAHTDHVMGINDSGFGPMITVSGSKWYWINNTIRNNSGTGRKQCVIHIWDGDTWLYVGGSTNEMTTSDPIRYIQFGQFGHTGVDDFTIIDNIVINTNGISPLGP